MRKIILLVILYNCLPILNAQPFFDILNIHGQWGEPHANNSKDSSEIDTRYFEAALSIPVKIKNDVFAISSSFSQLSFKSDYSERVRMQSYLLSLALVKQWKNERIKTSFVFISRSNNDLDINISGSSMQLGGAIVHSIKKSEKLKYKFGAYYNSEFFGPFILPLAGIDWNINERLNLFGLLPGSMNLEFLLSKKIHLGIAFRSITNSYRLVSNTFIRINDNHLKMVADFYFLKNHVISLEAGHSVLRKYKPGIRINSETSYTDLNVNDGYLVKIGYSFRFRLDEK